MSLICVKVPGTTANCGPGFDSVGMACTIYNELTVELNDTRTITVDVVGEGAGTIPANDKNIVIRAMELVFQNVGFELNGVHLNMVNRIPLARGLGSSAAAIVAGLVAANGLTGGHLSKDQLLDLATEIEGHPDNVAPAIYGGVTVSIMKGKKADCLQFLPQAPLTMVVAVPDFVLSTKTARQVLPKQVSYQDALFNVSRSSLLIGALCTGEYRHLKAALEDRLHQPYRKSLIKGIDDVFEAAMRAGALGTAISGSGPTLIAFTNDHAQSIGRSMVEAFNKHDVQADYHVLDLDTQGAQIVS